MHVRQTVIYRNGRGIKLNLFIMATMHAKLTWKPTGGLPAVRPIKDKTGMWAGGVGSDSRTPHGWAAINKRAKQY